MEWVIILLVGILLLWLWIRHLEKKEEIERMKLHHSTPSSSKKNITEEQDFQPTRESNPPSLPKEQTDDKKYNEVVSTSSGYIYILANSSFSENLLKIGKTTRSVEQRAKELSEKTGMPTPFTVVYSVKVPDCDKAEKKVHEKLEHFRTSADREFFKLSLDQAKEAVWKVAEEQILYRLAVSEWELRVSDPKDETPFHAAAREARNEIRKRVEAKDPNAWEPSVWEGIL